MKFPIKDFFSKCDQIRSFLRIWSHLLKKFLMENLIFCAVSGLLDGELNHSENQTLNRFAFLNALIPTNSLIIKMYEKSKNFDLLSGIMITDHGIYGRRSKQ